MFNKSRNMSRAWEICRVVISFPRFSGHARFARCLRSAWPWLHKIVVRAFYAAQAIVRQNMNKVELLREEITMLQLKSIRINITEKHHDLEAQIEALAA